MNKNEIKNLSLEQLSDELFNIYYSQGFEGLKPLLVKVNPLFTYIDFLKMAKDLKNAFKNLEN